MKKIISIILLLSLMVAVIPAAQADLMSEARGMLQMINDFRTGGNAWYWNRDNKTKTQKKGLGKLQYDDELEAVALVRAKELAVRFDHTRPDGTDCFTAFPSNRTTMGENIACGYPTAREAFEGFLEEDEDYSGQGHRRIMLTSDMSRVGIAAVDVNGTRYWVQEFASAPTEESVAVDSGSEGWEKSGKDWVYRKKDGTLVTGWLKSGGKWYYMNNKGIMQTGWVKDGKKWYYMNKSGEMQTGWLKDARKWYYLNKDDGSMATGWVKDGGTKYYMDSSGAMVTGWKKISGKWYYFQSSGAMQTGWLKDGKTWYYLYKDGTMATGTVKIDGSTEVFNASGAWQYTQLQDYDTPKGTEDEDVILVKAALQMLVMRLFGFD